MVDAGPSRIVRTVQTFGRSAGTDETAVATSLFCQAWAVSVTRAAIACLVGARRVPDVASSNTDSSSTHEGRPAGASPPTPRFAAVAGDDDAAADPWAEILDDDDALFDWARSRLFDGHLAPLVEALHDTGARSAGGSCGATSPRPPPAGSPPCRRLPDPPPSTPSISCSEAPRAARRARLPHRGPGRAVPRRTHDGGVRLFVRRQTCCLRYRLPDAPPTCLSCRLLPETERRRRITLRLDRAELTATPPGTRAAGVGWLQKVVVGDRPAVGAGVVEPQEIAGPELVDGRRRGPGRPSVSTARRPR